MARITVPEQVYVEALIQKTGEVLEDQFFSLQRSQKLRIRNLNKEAWYVRSKSLGFHPIFDLHVKIKTKLNEQVIQSIRARKLKHVDVSEITGIPRPKITAIMNRQLKDVSIESLLRILGSLGLHPTW